MAKDRIYFIEKKITIIVVLLIGMFAGLLLDKVWAMILTSVIAIMIELSWGEDISKLDNVRRSGERSKNG